MPKVFDEVASRVGVFSPEQLHLIKKVYLEICAEHKLSEDDVRREALAIALTFPEHATSDSATLKAAGLRGITFA